ncbi:MAG: hypothetical protein Kow0029_03820 [Candidatus Rifleibacteriota bacterium]
MMDLSVLVFFQKWLIENRKELDHSMTNSSGGDQGRHPPDQRLE